MVLKYFSDDEPLKCKYCDKVFAKASNLHTHEATHTGQGCFQCQVCGKGYTFRFELHKHMRSHPGKLSTGCPRKK